MLKEKLKRNERCVGAWVLGTSADNAGVLATAGLDFLVIDHEHGQGTIADAIAQLRAIEATDCAGIVRVPANDPVYIRRILDAGAAGIIVPNVSSAKEAQRVVDACRHPPASHCGVYNSMRAMEDESNAGDQGYVAPVFIAVQVESRAAIDRIDEIVTTEGIDLILIGPRAAPTGAGTLYRFGDAAMRTEIDRAERVILASGKPLGSIAANGRTAAGMFERGYALVIVGSDLTLLDAGAAAMLKAAHATVGAGDLKVEPEPATAGAAVMEQPMRARPLRNADTSIRRMRQFWVAWCVAVLLLGAAIIGFGYLFALSEGWSQWAKLGARVAAGLLAAFAVYDAYRIAARGTAALQEVLAQNLGSIVVAELERLHAAAAQRKLALAAKEDAKLGSLGLSLESWSFDDEDVRNLLGNPTEEALRTVLASIEEYNRMIDALEPGDTPAECGLMRQIEEISAGINRAIASVAVELDAYRRRGAVH